MIYANSKYYDIGVHFNVVIDRYIHRFIKPMLYINAK